MNDLFDFILGFLTCAIFSVILLVAVDETRMNNYLLENNLAHYNSKSGMLVKDSLNFRNDTIFIIRKEN